PVLSVWPRPAAVISPPNPNVTIPRRIGYQCAPITKPSALVGRFSGGTLMAWAVAASCLTFGNVNRVSATYRPIGRFSGGTSCADTVGAVPTIAVATRAARRTTSEIG